MKRLYERNELTFSLVWIGLYVVVMNAAMQFCGGFDDLANKTVGQLLVPVGCIAAISAAATVWIVRNGLQRKYGLCALAGSGRSFLWFVPLILVTLTNCRNGLGLSAPLMVSLLMMANMALAGYAEEIIFRGFLFRAMEKNGLRSAVIVSAVTFGAGHIVNLANTADTLGVLLQVCYAITIGLMYTVIVWKGGSLIPCMVSHMLVNGSSVFALEQGPYTSLVQTLTRSQSMDTVQTFSAVLLMAVSGAYALWLWKKHPGFDKAKPA